MSTLIILCAKYMPAVACAAVVVTWFFQDRVNRRSLIMRGIAAGALGTAFAWIVGSLYNEPRPFVRLGQQPLIPHIADNGFPSDHTLLAALCALLVLPYSSRAGVVAGVAALITGWARVACLLHTPLDILTSFALAGLACFLSAKLVRRRPKDYGLYPRRGSSPAGSVSTTKLSKLDEQNLSDGGTLN